MWADGSPEASSGADGCSHESGGWLPEVEEAGGYVVGRRVGAFVGRIVGALVGDFVGFRVGARVGLRVVAVEAGY